MLKFLLKHENVFVNVLEVSEIFFIINFDFLIYFFYNIIAAAKLANATRTHKNLTINNSLNDNHQKPSFSSSIMHPTNSSLKYSASNGSVMENFSTDDAEEALCPKTDCTKVLPYSNPLLNNQFIQSQRSDISTSQNSLSNSVDESKIFSMSKLTFI